METPWFKSSETRLDSATSSDLYSSIEQDMTQLVASDLLSRQMIWENGDMLFNDVGIYGKRGGWICHWILKRQILKRGKTRSFAADFWWILGRDNDCDTIWLFYLTPFWLMWSAFSRLNLKCVRSIDVYRSCFSSSSITPVLRDF